eukprot:CAMPEP_0172860420 /NCGR_PEP_ID=MMETSP1075-20121228/72074_2 /TAXON_ID=2916 /ORGANISM="Ceratium fusus, Strain PA161109" /LENGTH=58 /DNA_ID=CAMNT_0013708445 /DNA_START=477 /DNA_END=654 /DNA_ORIENTATION=-
MVEGDDLVLLTMHDEHWAPKCTNSLIVREEVKAAPEEDGLQQLVGDGSMTLMPDSNGE